MSTVNPELSLVFLFRGAREVFLLMDAILKIIIIIITTTNS